MKMQTMGYKNSIVRTRVLYYIDATLYNETFITLYAITWLHTARIPNMALGKVIRIGFQVGIC